MPGPPTPRCSRAALGPIAQRTPRRMIHTFGNREGLMNIPIAIISLGPRYRSARPYRVTGAREGDR